MTAPMTSPTVAAANLLLAARRTPGPHSRQSLELFLDASLRYSHAGPGSRTVSPTQAFAELLERNLVDGTPENWWVI